MSIEARLSTLNITLPDAPAPAANYVPFVRTDNLLFVSGQISAGPEGLIRGRLGDDLDVAAGAAAARACGLSLLAQYQPDRIKIDHELIRNIHQDGPRQSIVQAIIKCCTSLEIAVSAVGVERAEEWMWLESAGISQFQGNLFASARLGGLPAVAWPEKK